MSRTVVLLRYWLPVVVWMALIFSGSGDTLSSRRTSRFIGPLLRWFNPGISEAAIRQVQTIVRKGGHLTEYAVLAVLLWRARRRPVHGEPRPWRWADAVFAWCGATLYSITDEIHQSFVPSRQGQVTDVVIDAGGALLGLLLLWGFGRWRRFW